MEKKFLQSVRGVTRMNRVMNEEVRCKVGLREKMGYRLNRKVLKRFVQVERMSGERFTKNTSLGWRLDAVLARGG